MLVYLGKVFQFVDLRIYPVFVEVPLHGKADFARIVGAILLFVVYRFRSYSAAVRIFGAEQCLPVFCFYVFIRSMIQFWSKAQHKIILLSDFFDPRLFQARHISAAGRPNLFSAALSAAYLA